MVYLGYFLNDEIRSWGKSPPESAMQRTLKALAIDGHSRVVMALPMSVELTQSRLHENGRIDWNKRNRFALYLIQEIFERSNIPYRCEDDFDMYSLPK